MNRQDTMSEQLSAMLANGSTQCPVCGKTQVHQHSPDEIVIYSNGVKAGERRAALATANERIRELEAIEKRLNAGWNVAHFDILERNRLLAAERDVSDKLEKALQLAAIQYMGCGGNLTPDEIVSAMRCVILDALSEVAAIRAKQGGEV